MLKAPSIWRSDPQLIEPLLNKNGLKQSRVRNREMLRHLSAAFIGRTLQ